MSIEGLGHERAEQIARGKEALYLVQDMCNAVLQNQVRSYNLGVVEVEIVSLHGYRHSRTSLCNKFEAVCERRQVADKVWDDVAVHQAGSSWVGA